MLPTIRLMTPHDVDVAVAALLAGAFGDRRAWLAFAAAHDHCVALVAERDRTIVGTAVGTVNRPVGWLATIWVAADERGRGLGRALTQAAIDRLGAMGCRSTVLVSTEEGRPLYERMGFEVQSWYRILEARGTDAAADAGVRWYAASDGPALAALDAAATGEDRRHLLDRFVTTASTRVVGGEPGAVRGYVARAPWGGGATVAPEPADAMRLLEARRSAAGPDGRVRVGLLSDNEPGLAMLERAGLQPIWSAPRMIRGEVINWHPEWIWGQFNHAVG